ncbi:MAG: hypothetical protein Q4P31_02615 [Andreesenia angusta]|nr:hypothetical protein [Andreesenia angusta]
MLLQSLDFDINNLNKRLIVIAKKSMVEEYRNLSIELNLMPKYFSPYFSRITQLYKNEYINRKGYSKLFLYKDDAKVDISVYEDGKFLFFKSYDTIDMESIYKFIEYFNLEILDKPIRKLIYFGDKLNESEIKRFKDMNIISENILESIYLKSFNIDEPVIKMIEEDPEFINSIIALYR